MTSRSFSQSRLDRMHNVMNGHVERGDIPGIVTLVARHDEVHVDAIGTLAHGGNEPMQRDTIFRIASMTKPIAAVGALILIEECRLRLDDPVDEFLPELANRQVLRSLDSEVGDTVPANRALTLRDLLTFTSGYGIVMAMPETYPIQRAMTAAGIVDGPPHPQEVPAPDAWLSRLAAFPLLTQPGERWHYNTASDIIGILIARASGQTFGNFLRERIFGPLGMVDTGFSVSPEKIDRLATSYETNPESGNLDVFDEAVGSQWSAPPSFESGAGGLVSTADDVLRFSRMLLAKGTRTNGQERVLSRAAVETMMTDQLTPEQKAASVPDTHILGLEGWGFGAAVTTRRTSLFANPGQFGWAGGLGTSWAIDRSENLIGLHLTQVALSSPRASAAMTDFWTSTYAAIDS